MDIFAAILTALDIADIRIFVVKYYWKQKALQISDDVRESFRVRLSFRINAEAFFGYVGFFASQVLEIEKSLVFFRLFSGGVQL